MDNRPAILGLANPPLSPTSLVLGLDTLASVEMTASKPRPIPPICLAFVRIVTWILLPGIGLAYTYQALTTTLGEWLSFLVSGFLLFLGGTWVAAPFLASSSSGQLLVTTAALCACGLLILLKLLFLFVVLIVGSLLLAGQAVSERRILGLLGDIFWGCLSVVLTVRRFVSNGSSPLPLSRRQPARREVVRENPNLRKLLVRPDISPPLAPKGTGCSAKLDVLRAMDNEVNNEAHRRMEEIRHLEEKFKAADAESVERIAVSNVLD
ncbi:hypothetical protein LXA43DRAFT_650177 [Ganoderma leucocontextum]|nr:hypothetical protein LXA43DRAFT_650177 [Ganoderma leucocontextum]